MHLFIYVRLLTLVVVLCLIVLVMLWLICFVCWVWLGVTCCSFWFLFLYGVCVPVFVTVWFELLYAL